jgi:hypothetical protein
MFNDKSKGKKVKLSNKGPTSVAVDREAGGSRTSPSCLELDPHRAGLELPHGQHVAPDQTGEPSLPGVGPGAWIADLSLAIHPTDLPDLDGHRLPGAEGETVVRETGMST